MNISFTKYQGTGNDFVMLNNISGVYNDLSVATIAHICDRKLGIGADGLILINKSEEVDFYVDYYNADGTQSFCGNGARCSVAFAKEIGLINSDAIFEAIDGQHKASIEGAIVRLEMLPVAEIISINDDYFLDTGSPHYVHIKQEDDGGIVDYGKEIRFSELYKKQGVNVNYLMPLVNDLIEVETYERGVEDETLSCGTGVTACALVQMKLNAGINKVNVTTKGGNLTVEAIRNTNEGYSDIWLSGPTKHVFDGSIVV
ncbi:MAG: diaminopimelate epimerase [Flavobacteriaceae bacterium]|jgi:diaminopimelate epimerase